MGKLSQKDLLTIHELTLNDVNLIFDKATELKEKHKKREPHEELRGRTVATFYEKPSLRTRVSFEAGVAQLGGHALYIKAIPGWKYSDTHLKEGITDLARVLSRYVDAIVARVYEHEKLVEMSRYASIPVINALSDLTHPCQGLADLFTIKEHKGKLKGLKIAYVGDGGSNMGHTTLLGAVKVGMNIAMACPENPKYRPSEKIMEWAKVDAEKSGATIEITNNPEEAVKEADIIYTDVWVSMGMEAEAKERLQAFQGYQVNMNLVQKANEDVKVMHCLPRTEHEISNDVVESPYSIIFDQAENRMHVQKAILTLLID